MHQLQQKKQNGVIVRTVVAYMLQDTWHNSKLLMTCIYKWCACIWGRSCLYAYGGSVYANEVVCVLSEWSDVSCAAPS